MAVSVDPFEDTEAMIARMIEEYGVEPDYAFLSDEGHRVIDRYGLLNPESERPIPHPTTFVIDREGVVRWKFVEVDYTIRPSNEMILDALDRVAPS